MAHETVYTFCGAVVKWARQPINCVCIWNIRTCTGLKSLLDHSLRIRIEPLSCNQNSQSNCFRDFSMHITKLSMGCWRKRSYRAWSVLLYTVAGMDNRHLSSVEWWGVHRGGLLAKRSVHATTMCLFGLW